MLGHRILGQRELPGDEGKPAAKGLSKCHVTKFGFRVEGSKFQVTKFGRRALEVSSPSPLDPAK